MTPESGLFASESRVRWAGGSWEAPTRAEACRFGQRVKSFLVISSHKSCYMLYAKESVWRSSVVPFFTWAGQWLNSKNINNPKALTSGLWPMEACNQTKLHGTKLPPILKLAKLAPKIISVRNSVIRSRYKNILLILSHKILAEKVQKSLVDS